MAKTTIKPVTYEQVRAAVYELELLFKVEFSGFAAQLDDGSTEVCLTVSTRTWGAYNGIPTAKLALITLRAALSAMGFVVRQWSVNEGSEFESHRLYVIGGKEGEILAPSPLA